MPHLSIRIDFDHENFLGHSLAEIASEKAGILKPAVPAVVAEQRPEAREVILARAAELGSTNPRLYYDYAMVLRQMDAKGSSAIPVLKRAVELDPEYQDAHYYLAFCLTDERWQVSGRRRSFQKSQTHQDRTGILVLSCARLFPLPAGEIGRRTEGRGSGTKIRAAGTGHCLGGRHAARAEPGTRAARSERGRALE